MESEGPLRSSQEPAIFPYREPGEFRPYRALYLPKVSVKIFSNLRVGLSSEVFLSFRLPPVQCL